MPLNHRRCVAGLCMLYKVHGKPNYHHNGAPVCLRVRLTRAIASYLYEFLVPRCSASQFGRFIPPLPSAAFDSDTLNGLKVAVNPVIAP